MSMQNHVVIMAGGIGSRFWPMSTAQMPKQFLDILGTGRTLIQMTVDRFAPLCPPENIWVVTSASYVPIVREQLPQIPAGNILAEPAARNTAPCIAYACWKIRSRESKANIVVTPADAVVFNVDEFRRVIARALDFTACSDAIVTVGIKPTRPETGYGYIATSAENSIDIREVREFKEKPDLATAQKYLQAGNYLWNAGIFVWNSDTIATSIRAYAPDIAEKADELAAAAFEPAAVERIFPEFRKISIDYAVMEKDPNIYTIPGDFGWSDLGTWTSLRDNSGRDECGNAVIADGEVRMVRCSGCVVSAPDMKEVVLEGLEDCVVAVKDGRLLVCRLSKEQEIRDFHN